MQQWDAAITIDPNRPEGHAQFGRALYLVSEQLPDKNAQAQYVAEARAAAGEVLTERRILTGRPADAYTDCESTTGQRVTTPVRHEFLKTGKL